MASQDQQFGQAPPFSCGQIEAERNHDELLVRPANTIYRSDSWNMDWLNQYYTDLDTYHSHCNNFGAANTPAWNDERFIKYIFYDSCYWVPEKDIKNHLFNNIGWEKNNPSHTVRYKGQSWQQQGLGYNTFNGKLYSYWDFSNKKTLRAMINRINEHLRNVPNPANKIGAYMFVDVGKGLLTRLNSVMNANDPIFHVINSQASLADSAKEGKQIYDTLYFRNKVHCWWYMKNLFVPSYNPHYIVPAIPYNHSFHSGIQCIMSDAGAANPTDPAITQIWSDPQTNNVLYTTYDACATNNRTIVNTDILNASTYGATSPNIVSLSYHRKRSGDGFAIWFMEQFATILANGNSTDFFHTCGYGICDPPPYPDYGLVDFIHPSVNSWSQLNKKKYIRYHSFYITGDYPAFCWAAYCHCNVIYNEHNVDGGRALIFLADKTAICY